MNKRQLEVQKAFINDEKALVKQLEDVYANAKADCEQRIRELSARTDMQNLQTIIYQKQYQEALKKQLEGILDGLHSQQFTNINDYLISCYQTGFIGALYDLHGQGIPLIFPISQDQVAKAINVDAKLSKGMYARLGEDIAKLKEAIRYELSRGVAGGLTWHDIADLIAKGMNSPIDTALYNALRIARTEGHRVQQASQYDSLTEAKDNGANIVKQWDSTLDDRTRESHRLLDGQIRELDEPFEVYGLKAMYPGDFGEPGEDINCRCCCLQRARWALDADELKTLQDRANYFGLDKTKDFNEFKEKYMNIA
jgi:hypothetical protein